MYVTVTIHSLYKAPVEINGTFTDLAAAMQAVGAYIKAADVKVTRIAVTA